MSCFWHYLTLLMEIKHKASTSFHPQSDGSNKQTNKTLIQSLRFHVGRNQTGWVAALPCICFNIFPTFHINLVKPFLSNNDNKFSHCAIRTTDSSEFFVESILDHKPWGRGHQYLVKFRGYPDSFDCWLSSKDLQDDSALASYLLTIPLVT